MTIPHQKLALTFLAFSTRSLLRSDKKLRKYLQDFSDYSHIWRYFNIHLVNFRNKLPLKANSVAGRNESV